MLASLAIIGFRNMTPTIYIFFSDELVTSCPEICKGSILILRIVCSGHTNLKNWAIFALAF
jgi:hypothetical protein